MQAGKIFVLTGAGVSAESGLSTFRDKGGLWEQYNIEDVASLSGYERNPAKVLDFYNLRRNSHGDVAPNAAHMALAELEAAWERRGGQVESEALQLAGSREQIRAAAAQAALAGLLKRLG